MRALYRVTVLSVASLWIAACSEEEAVVDPVRDAGAGADAGARDGGSADAGGMDASSPDGGMDASTAPDGAVDGSTPDASGPLALSVGDWVVYENPYGDGTPNPTDGITGTATATRNPDGGTRVTLSVANLPAGRAFGSHVHRDVCGDKEETNTLKAGPHYQHVPAPADAGTDSQYANPTNEVWLDFTTDGTGAATVSADVPFVVRSGEANAIIVHDMATQTADGVAGVAGPKLSCLNIPF